MKKIAIITTGLSKVLGSKKCGGGEVLLKNLILELINMKNISLYVYYPAIDDVTEDIKNNYPTINFSSYNKSPSYYQYINELQIEFEKEKFDKIINYNMVVPYETTMLQSHSYIHKLNKAFILFRPVKKFLLRHKLLMQKRAIKRAEIDSDYIAVSEIIKKDYVRNFNIPSEKIKVIYPGVNIKNLEKTEKKKVITFGIVANSSINKGGHYLLTVLGILSLSGFNFKLIMIAPKFKKDFLMQIIINIFNLRKKIEVLPYQNDMAYFYQNIDVLVLPSLNEAFGLVVLEAMERAKPCIVSSTAGSSEIINNKNGFIFNRSSFFDFIKKIRSVINLYNKDFNNFKNISEEARKTAENFSWDKFAVKVIETNE